MRAIRDRHHVRSSALHDNGRGRGTYVDRARTREREREGGGVNERVIDRIVIRRTMLDGLRGLGHLMHVVPSPWIRAGVS